jgi:hypothetical protein
MCGNKKRFTIFFVLLLLGVLASFWVSSASSQHFPTTNKNSAVTTPFFVVGVDSFVLAAKPGSTVYYRYRFSGRGISGVKVTLLELPPQMQLLRKGSKPMFGFVGGKPTWRIGELHDPMRFSRYMEFKIYLRASARTKKQLCFKTTYLGSPGKGDSATRFNKMCIVVRKKNV